MKPEKRRVRGNRRSSSKRGTPGTSRQEAERAVARLVLDVRRQAKGLAAADPLAAELIASGMLSLLHTDWPDDREALEALGAELLAGLERSADADTMVLFLAIQAIADGPMREWAGAAVARLRARTIPEPIWSRTLGRPAFIDGWISTDELEDQSNLALTFAHDRRPGETIVALLDANFGGLVRQAFVAANPDKVRREWAQLSGLPARPIEAQEAADRLANGIQQFDGYLDPPVDEEAKRLMPLLRARLRLLPPARPIEPRYLTQKARARLVTEFVASPEAATLGKIGRSRAANLASWFIDYACDYGAGDPVRWSPIAVEILLADWLPRKASLLPEEVARLPHVLRAFIRFAARAKGLQEAVFAEIPTLSTALPATSRPPWRMRTAAARQSRSRGRCSGTG